MQTTSSPTLSLAAVAVAVASLFAASPALADVSNGFGVATAGQTGDPYPFIRAASAYRTGQNSSGNYTTMTDTAPARLDECARAVANNFTCVATLGGTNSPSYNLTASTSSVGLTTSFVANSATLLTSSVTSRADLSTGKLGVNASTGYRHGALGTAQFTDTLTFNVANATATTVTLITVGFTLDGSLFSTAGGIADVTNSMNFGNATARVDHGVSGDSSMLSNFTSSRSQGNWVSFNWLSSTPGLTQFSGVYALTGASTVLGIYDYLYADAGNQEARSLYGSTSAFSLSVPTGVTYTSASGVFLNAVPEPHTVPLMLVGLAGMAAFMRRRQR